MKVLATAALLACIAFEPALAGASDASRDSAIANILRQRLQDWETAVHDGDVDKVAAIEADDWRSVGYRGDVSNKQDDLSDLKAGKDKHLRLELGPMDVKVLSDTIAVVQSTATAATDNGGPGGTYAFMDVFVKRGGNWTVTRSLAAKIK